MHERAQIQPPLNAAEIAAVCPRSDHFFYLKLPGGEHTCSTGYWVPDLLPHQYTGFKPGFIVQYLLSGDGEYEDEAGGQVLLKPGVMLFREGAIRHTIRRRATSPWRSFFLVLPQHLARGLREVGILDPQVLTHFRPVSREVLDEFNQFIGHARRVNLGNQRQFMSMLHQLILDFSPVKSLPAQDRYLEGKLAKSRELLSDISKRDLGIPDIAGQVGMGYHHFRKEFTRSVGLSPSEYRIRSVILRAQEMCMHHCWTFEKIADDLGYPDAASFSKQFKRVTGCSPREYRRRKAGAGP